jgi:hypothetical protein
MGLSGAVGSGAETPVARDDELDPGTRKDMTRRCGVVRSALALARRRSDALFAMLTGILRCCRRLGGSPPGRARVAREDGHP